MNKKISLGIKHVFTNWDDYKKLLYETPPSFSGKRPKISSVNFVIPQYNQAHHLVQRNYNVKQLKEISRFYKQKRTGNKSQLIHSLYNFLRLSSSVVSIQKNFRGFLCRRFIKLHGPAFYDRKCINETDFITMEKLTKIPNAYFFSIKGTDSYIYGYDICSLYNYIKKGGKKNPYTRKKFSKKLSRKVMEYIRVAKALKEKINLKFEDSFDGLSAQKRLELHAVSTFQRIDDLGNHTNSKWFLLLNRPQLIKFGRELVDIWCWRANLSPQSKRNICPPDGNPFVGVNMNESDLHYNRLRKKLLNIIDIFVTRGNSTDSRALGALFILTALTLVSKPAAEALPYLYESAVYH